MVTDVWYVPGVGQVKSIIYESDDMQVNSETELVSYELAEANSTE